MSTQPKNRLVPEGFPIREVNPGLFELHVLDDRCSRFDNPAWRNVGSSFAKYATETNKTVVLVSTFPLEHYIVKELNCGEKRSSFHYEDKTYFVTTLVKESLETYIPDITELDEFIFCMNTWLYFVEEGEVSDAEELCRYENTLFLHEMKQFISNLQTMWSQKLSIELVVGDFEGNDLLWFNQKGMFPSTTVPHPVPGFQVLKSEDGIFCFGLGHN